MCLPNVSKAEVNHPHIYHFYGWHKPSKYGWLWCCFTNIGVFRLAFLIWNWSKQTCLDILGCVMAGRGWHNWRCLLQQVSRSVTKKNLLKLRNTKTGFRVDQLHRPNRKHTSIFQDVFATGLGRFRYFFAPQDLEEHQTWTQFWNILDG